MSNPTWNMTPAEIASLQQMMEELCERHRALSALAHIPCTGRYGHRLRSYDPDAYCLDCGLTAAEIGIVR